MKRAQMRKSIMRTIFSHQTYKYNYCTPAVEVLLPVGLIPEYLSNPVHKARTRLIWKLEES
eukprot:3079145-Rhodomonas_salina.1